MAHVLEIPEDLYQKLQRIAEETGVTPVQWIQATIARQAQTAGEIPPLNLAEALAPYIGVVDSSTQKPYPRYRNEVGDIIDEKFSKQGITPPQWER